MESDIRASEPHPTSRRRAIVEDDGDSVWLYLTVPNGLSPSADCWLYNRQAVRSDIKTRPHDRPPPAPDSVALPNSSRSSSLPERIQFQWDSDGESVAVSVDGEALGFILAGQRHGYSRYLHVVGPWGNPFDHSTYERVFGPSRPAA